MKKILLLSDTHDRLDKKIISYISKSDQVWHAGDIGSSRVLDNLSELKPLRAVYGNIDGNQVRLQLPEVLFFDCEGISVLMIHIAGYPGRYNSKTRDLIIKYKQVINLW